METNSVGNSNVNADQNVLFAKDSADVGNIVEGEVEETEKTASTTYLESLMHLLKGNIGTGCFAMAEAVKNGGILLAPVLTLLLGIICIHVQHILLQCSSKMRVKYELATKPDYAETVEFCFLSSSSKRCQNLAPTMKLICNIFLCVTQLGFCSIYGLSVGNNIKQVFDFYGIEISIYLWVFIALVPIWLSALITNLKYLAPFSAIANICMITALVICYYYSAMDLPPINERNFVPADFSTLPLFFGTAVFAFEGIALVLPLQNSMKEPKNFSRSFGVLNVGVGIAAVIYISIGTIGYWKYGESTEASLTLNLPTSEILAQCVKLAAALGVMLGYAIMFFIAIQIIFPSIRSTFKFVDRHPFAGELLFRSFMVLVTFAVAELVPHLGLFISLLGAVCSSVIAIALPPLIELVVLSSEEGGVGWFTFFKNVVIILLALVGLVTGAYESLSSLIKAYN